MTARDDVLRAAFSLVAHGSKAFSPAEVIAEARRQGSTYRDSTLRTHVVGVMCVNTPAHWVTKYGDLRRVSRGRYELVGAADDYPRRLRVDPGDFDSDPPRTPPTRAVAPERVESSGPPARAVEFDARGEACPDERPGRRRIGLVGCVKEKAGHARPARDLYTSTLFTGRRRYVEASCDEWWVLSAVHGLVHPDEVLEPYDVALKSASRRERRHWTAGVVKSIDERIRPLRGDVVELHAGAEYRGSGLIDALRSRGCVIENPTEGLPIGRQLRFYRQADRP